MLSNPQVPSARSRVFFPGADRHTASLIVRAIKTSNGFLVNRHHHRFCTARTRVSPCDPVLELEVLGAASTDWSIVTSVVSAAYLPKCRGNNSHLISGPSKENVPQSLWSSTNIAAVKHVPDLPDLLSDAVYSRNTQFFSQNRSLLRKRRPRFLSILWRGTRKTAFCPSLGTFSLTGRCQRGTQPQ